MPTAMGIAMPAAAAASTDPHVQAAARAAAFSRLIILLSAITVRFRDEIQLQDAIARLLRADGMSFEREVDLGSLGRIDFMVHPRIGLEVKVRIGISPLTRQLHRYAECPYIDELVLATTSVRHRSLLPDRMLGKPVTVIPLLGAVL